ncbi:hypothetical protein BGZ50_006518 [Haplosporangium sp. Z 11]|nr:hypothetical protein BGZ50_006518 [Haplosporangium sp. Z 11]
MEVARRFGYPFTTVHDTARAFGEGGLIEVKKRGGNKPERFSQRHIRWLSDHLLTCPDYTIATLCEELNHHFALTPPVPLSEVFRVIRNQVDYTLKLLRQKPVDYNNSERIQERMIWPQSVPEDMYEADEGFVLG